MALRVLVADDEPDLLSTLSEELEHSGAVVSRATTGGELLDMLADHGPFDLVITDISMPWMTGLHVMHSECWAGLSTPVIVMTGLPDESIDDRVRALGDRAALLRKPFHFDTLKATIAKLMETENAPGA